MFSQLPSAPPGSIENWLIPAAAVASMALLFKKLFGHKAGRNGGSPPGPPGPAEPPPFLVTKTELHRETNAVRDKIDARFLALSEKIDRIADRLTRIESAIARLDERTRK